jgi:pyruvate/2-oxoglutarate dehydrogenase complex dihydrolipoamide acyltransferase (E2) component
MKLLCRQDHRHADQAFIEGRTYEVDAAAAELLLRDFPDRFVAVAPRVAPPVRRLAAELQVAIETVEGSGRNGALRMQDVRAAAAMGGE